MEILLFFAKVAAYLTFGTIFSVLLVSFLAKLDPEGEQAYWDFCGGGVLVSAIIASQVFLWVHDPLAHIVISVAWK